MESKKNDIDEPICKVEIETENKRMATKRWGELGDWD